MSDFKDHLNNLKANICCTIFDIFNFYKKAFPHLKLTFIVSGIITLLSCFAISRNYNHSHYIPDNYYDFIREYDKFTLSRTPLWVMFSLLWVNVILNKDIEDKGAKTLNKTFLLLLISAAIIYTLIFFYIREIYDWGRGTDIMAIIIFRILMFAYLAMIGNFVQLFYIIHIDRRKLDI